MWLSTCSTLQIMFHSIYWMGLLRKVMWFNLAQVYMTKKKQQQQKFYSILNAAMLTYKGNSWVGKSEIEPIFEGECSNKCIL